MKTAAGAIGDPKTGEVATPDDRGTLQGKSTMVPVANQEIDLARALRPWTDRAAGLVQRRIEDARQHAAVGSLLTAEARLLDLLGSLTRHVSDARGHFYKQSFNMHGNAGLDPAVHQIGLWHTAEGEAVARTVPILGRSYQVHDLVKDARAALQSAGLAEQSSGPDAPYLENWAAEHGERIAARVSGELSNSQIAIFEAVGQILVKPEFR
jgi:hypothetical protein